MRATWSAISVVVGDGSSRMASVCSPGGSYSRTTSSPCRALERQWMRRSAAAGAKRDLELEAVAFEDGGRKRARPQELLGQVFSRRAGCGHSVAHREAE